MSATRGALPPRLLRSAQADVRARYIVNFRVDPAVVRSLLPVRWLEPQVINGFAVLSFCPYLLEAVRLAVLPRALGIRSICSAYRLAVIDHSATEPRAAVWVPARETDARTVANIGPGALRAGFERVAAAITPDRSGTSIDFSRLSGERYFRARLEPTLRPDGVLFGDTEAFRRFFAAATTSWAPSSVPGRMLQLDLDAGETVYSPLAVTAVEASGLPDGATIDSAFLGLGGTYCWSCVGLRHS